MKHLLFTTIAAVLLTGTALAGPIHDAAVNGDLAGVQAKLDKGVDVDAKGDDGVTPLLGAAQEGHKEIVELLLAAGADMNTKDDDGRTSLHMVADIGHNGIAELLIANGADVNAKNKVGDAPLDFANYGRYFETADLLRKHGAKTGEELKALFHAVENEDFEAVKQAIADGMDVNAMSRFGRTPLHLAAYKGHKEIVELLIAKGADVNAKTVATTTTWLFMFLPGADTPLHHAVHGGHNEVIELLIAAGADVNAKSESVFKATTPLSGFKLTTPLDWAEDVDQDDSPEVEAPRKEIAALLRKHGGKRGEELPSITLLEAAERGDLQEVKDFLANGADVNMKAAWGTTPLHASLFSMHKEVSELLVAEGADLNIKQENGETILHQAIDARLPTGFYSLEIAEWLISNGADVNAEYDHGVTPLFLAVQAWREEAVQLLIDNGADLNIISRSALWGFVDATPLDYAIEEDFDEIADLLRKHGGKTVEELKAIMPRLVQHGRFPFRFGTKEGMTYEVQDSLNLTNWEVIKTYKGTGGAVRFDEERDHDPPQIFYRIKVVD